MRSAASNETAGPVMAFAGMNMAANAGGVNTQDLFAMEQQQALQPQEQTPSKQGWACQCGFNDNAGRFCSDCGLPKPEPALPIKCGECNWELPDQANIPKFCQECGAKFGNS
jgi:membrane protease subunit (stomatin/prohibitin family)